MPSKQLSIMCLFEENVVDAVHDNCAILDESIIHQAKKIDN